MKLQQFKSKSGAVSYFTILPIEIIKGFGWKLNDKLKHKITGEGKIELSKLELIKE